MSARPAIVAAGLAAALLALTGSPAITGTARPAAGVGHPAARTHLDPHGAPPYRLPLTTGTVLRRYAAGPAAWSPGHRGVDLAAEVGDVVIAPAEGVVAFVGTVVDRDVLTINHPDGLRTSLEPVLTAVDIGQAVDAGQPVGAVQDATSHCDPATCLHWGVRRNRTYLDPLSLLAHAGPVVLLPVPGT